MRSTLKSNARQHLCYFFRFLYVKIKRYRHIQCLLLSETAYSLKQSNLLTWISTLSQDWVFNMCQPAQLECLYLDKTAVCPKITHAVAPLGFLLAHPLLLSSKRQRGFDLSSLPVVFVLCMVPYLDLFSPFRLQQVIN